jgi:PAS domain S-box-containing protein
MTAGGRDGMGASRAGSVAVTADSGLSAAAPVAVVDYAVDQLLCGAVAPDALSAVLRRLAKDLGGQAALAVQYTAGRKLVVLAAHPRRAAGDPALLTSIGALCAERVGQAAADGWLQAPLTSSGQAGSRASMLMAWAPPDADELPSAPSLCTLVLVGDASSWTAETGPALRVIAAFVAAQIRRAGDAAELAERVAISSGLIKGSPDPIIAINSDLRIVEFSPAAEELIGRRRADVMGEPAADVFMSEQEKARFERGAEAFLRDGDRGEYVGRLRVPVLRADGTELTVELTPVQLTIDGEVHFCGFLRDLTDLEHSQAALAESEARFRLLAQVAPVGIVQSDASGQCTFANDRWCALAGMTATDALGAGWTEALHPGDVERIEEEWIRAADRGTELRTDCRLRPGGGDEVWVHMTVMSLPGSDRHPGGYLTSITNITGRKRAEAERERLLVAERRARRSLADQTARLGSLITAAIPGVLFADEHGRITQLNQSFCDLFGITQDPGELTGTPTVELAREIRGQFADPAAFVRRTSEALAARRPASGEQMPCTDGRTLEGDYWPVFVDGHYRGDLWLAWDMSERKALEDQRERLLTSELAARELAETAQQRLEEQNAKLREIDDAKTQFLATVSHELRTPLASIISFVQLITGSEPDLSPGTASSLDVIQRSARRLLHVVGDLLLLSRIEGGSMPLDLAPVSIPELIADVARSAAPDADQRGVLIEVSAEDGPPVLGDQVRLYQVFENLMSNAMKFTAREGTRDDRAGRVRLTATHDGAAWRVDVEDSGIGIPPGELAGIFDRFARGSNARTAGLPGAGLGLSVVKAIAEQHGGRVEADSAVGRGTTFRVYLPIHDER